MIRESETLELKKSTSELKEAIISIAAILNKHHKGEVCFGIDKDGNAVGQNITENTIRESNKIAIFKNRIKIYNPGSFPENLEPFDFISKDIESVHRNPLLANLLYYSKDMEKWGTGLRRIYSECAKKNVRVEFEKEPYGFSVIFYRKNAPENAPENLSAIQLSILEEIERKGAITYDELALRLQKDRATIMRNISKLKKLGCLRRIGPDKGGKWKINT